MIFFLIFFLKNIIKLFFLVLALRCGFEAIISGAVARSFIVFCNLVSTDRIIIAGCFVLWLYS